MSFRIAFSIKNLAKAAQAYDLDFISQFMAHHDIPARDFVGIDLENGEILIVEHRVHIFDCRVMSTAQFQAEFGFITLRSI